MEKLIEQVKQMETRTYPAAEFRFVEGENGAAPRIEGYAAVFDAPSEDLGGFREIVKPGAFTRTLQEGADVRLMINHEGLPLARTASKTLQLSQDARGLRFVATLDPTDPDVQRLSPKMKRGDVNQCSFAFATRADNWRSQDGQTIRELNDVDLSDVSVVTYPAYPQTAAAMRSMKRFNAVRAAGKPGETATANAGEQRATFEVTDDCLVYYCRWAMQESRDSFDSLNRVLDSVARIADGTKLDDQDLEAAEDLVSSLVDLIGKARRTKATLEALGAEDETEDDTDDDQPQKPATTTTDTAAADPNANAMAMLALADAEDDGDDDSE